MISFNDSITYIKSDKNTNKYDYQVTDEEILRKIGIESYTVIRSIEPKLYKFFYECENVDINGNILFLDINEYTPIELKKYIVLWILGINDVPEIIKELPSYSLMYPDKILKSYSLNPILIFFIILIFVLIISLIIYYSGIMAFIAKKYPNYTKKENYNFNIIK